jgi:hypothetical protein
MPKGDFESPPETAGFFDVGDMPTNPMAKWA